MKPTFVTPTPNIVPNQDHLLGTCGWQDGRAWHHDYKIDKKVWSSTLSAEETIQDLQSLLAIAQDHLAQYTSYSEAQCALFRGCSISSEFQPEYLAGVIKTALKDTNLNASGRPNPLLDTYFLTGKE